MTKKLKSEGSKLVRPTIQISRTRMSGKKRVDLFANIRNTEHPLDNIISPVFEPEVPRSHESDVEIINNDFIQENGITGIPSNTGITSIPNTTGTSNTTSITVNQKTKVDKIGKTTRQPISPVRDFTKTPNSVTRIILAQGLFRGKSKQIYDFLWSVSRGAIQPTRVFRKTHKEIQKGAGIGSRNTVIEGIKHLGNIGLIIKKSTVGVFAGNEYELFTPEELGYTNLTGITDTTGVTGTTGIAQNLVKPVIPEIGYTGTTQIQEKNSSYEDANTSYKDFKPDDEGRTAFFELNEVLSRTCEKLTGRKPSVRDAGKWKTLGELLILELEIAARRAGPISNVPAFLTEVLRRKLMNQPFSLPKLQNKKTDVVEKNGSGEFKVKPLDEKGREAAVEQLREFAGDDFLPEFKKWYTTEDWEWIMKQLGIN